jgi:hypothetical protein
MVVLALVGCSSFDQTPDTVTEVVAGDVLSIDVELGEDDLGDRPLHPIAAAPVEALGIGQQGESGTEEPSASFQLAGRVGKLRLDLAPVPLDVRQLLLELLSGPLGVSEQVEEAVLLGVEFIEAAHQALS